MGYRRAGFEVLGVDIEPQPHYPFEFVQDGWEAALEVLPERFEREGIPYAIHASPPCQAYSSMTKRWGRSGEHPDLIAAVRERLVKVGAPYVIENVVGAPLLDPVMLCGTMFGLGIAGTDYRLRRHRLFETSFPTPWPPASCAHTGRAVAVYGHAGGTSKRDGLRFTGTNGWREAMGIDWMTGSELAEAIPPAYTEWIGRRVLTEALR